MLELRFVGGGGVEHVTHLARSLFRHNRARLTNDAFLPLVPIFPACQKPEAVPDKDTDTRTRTRDQVTVPPQLAKLAPYFRHGGGVPTTAGLDREAIASED